eukprot:1164419-Amphidinium_carterae.1
MLMRKRPLGNQRTSTLDVTCVDGLLMGCRRNLSSVRQRLPNGVVELVKGGGDTEQRMSSYFCALSLMSDMAATHLKMHRQECVAHAETHSYALAPSGAPKGIGLGVCEFGFGI